MRVVISQPMYFPWVGLLDQVRNSDVFIHYDDVQYSRGFFNRVQIKTADGTRWLTVPLRLASKRERLDHCWVDDTEDWRRQHRRTILHALARAPFLSDALSLFDGVTGPRQERLVDLSIRSVEALSEYFAISPTSTFMRASRLGCDGTGTDRLVRLVRAVGGSVYVTGHGARHYLDHREFEREGISVEYMDYRCLPYPQKFGAFTPFVTALDLVANVGPEGVGVIQSGTMPWREFTGERDQQV